MPARVLVALLTVQLLFAIHYVVAKWVLGILPAPAWIALRVSGAALVLLGIALLRRAPFPRAPRTLAAIAGLSCFGVILNQIFFNEGLSRTVPSHSALINASIPVTTLLVAVLLRRESLTRRKVAALAFTLGGVLVLLLEKGFDFGNETLVGDLLCLTNATSFSIFLVLSRPLLRRYDAQAVTALLFAFGTLGTAIYGAPELAALRGDLFTPGLMLAAGFIILGPTAASYFLNSWALARVESSQVALYIYVQFVLTAPLSAVVLQERLSGRLGPAALLVFAGLWLASRRPDAARTTLRRWLPRVGFAAVAVAMAVWMAIRPSHDREWIPEMRRLPSVRFEGERVVIDGVRDVRWRSLDDFDLRHHARVIDLDRVESLWFCLSIFHPDGWRGPAHSLLSFRFDDGSTLAISVEARKEIGESYSIWRGMRKRFELMYVIGEERDLIANRAALRPDAVYLYPIAAAPEAVRAILRSLLEGARELEERPEFYHTVYNNCTTRLRDHVNAALPGSIPPSWKLLFPGYADELLAQLGLIEGEGAIAAARLRYDIKGRATAAADDPEFSERIRQE